MENLTKIFDFLHTIEKLKSTLRYNPTTSGRKESSAEHSWRLALMTFMISEELNLDIDKYHAVKIALVHDLAESLTGDYDSYETSKNEDLALEKNNLEKEAMQKLRSSLPEPMGDKILSLWQEYEDKETKEAKFVKAMDKIETLTQFIETGHHIFREAANDGHIALYADKQVKEVPELKPVLKIVKQKLKVEYIKGNFEWKPEYDNL